MIIFIIIKRSVVVVPGPHRSCVVRGISAKPVIVIIRCSTGLSSSCHIRIKLRFPAGSLLYNIFHGICKKPCSWLFHYLSGRSFITEENITITVFYCSVKNRIVISSLISNCSIGSSQFNIRYAIGDSSKREWLIHITFISTICIYTIIY